MLTIITNECNVHVHCTVPLVRNGLECFCSHCSCVDGVIVLVQRRTLRYIHVPVCTCLYLCVLLDKLPFVNCIPLAT